MHRGNCSYSEVSASEFVENHEEKFYQSYMHCDVCGNCAI